MCEEDERNIVRALEIWSFFRIGFDGGVDAFGLHKRCQATTELRRADSPSPLASSILGSVDFKLRHTNPTCQPLPRP
jgi:hypothetical protein